MNEQELIKQLKLGNEPAFKMLVEAHSNRVHYTVLNILQNAIDTEDIVQETFIQVFESIKHFKEASSLATWIYRIAVHKALDIIRKQKNRARLHAIVPWWMPDENKSIDAVYLNPGILIEHKEKAVRIFKAINELPHQQRVAFTLIKVQGMKYEEACEILQLSVKAVESLVSRARVKLKTRLENDY